MAGPRRITKGTRLAGIPADSWNAFVDTARIVSQQPPRMNGSGISHGPPEQVRVMVKNETGADLTERFPILQLSDPLVEPADITDDAQVVLAGVQFEGLTPGSGDTNFVVLQGPCKDGEFRPAALLGLTWVKVDVTDENHNYAATDASVEKLVSSPHPGVLMLWKDAGTGDKWAVISMDKRFTKLRWATVRSGGITAATGNDPLTQWGTGQVDPYLDDGSIGSMVEIDNPYPATFAEGYTVCYDEGVSPPRLVTGSCEGFPS